MRYRLTLIALAILFSGGMHTALRAETLTVVIENVTSDEGLIMVQLLPGEAAFNGESAATLSLMQGARAGELTFSSSNLPPGEYALRIMHDLNGNGEMDSNFVGMPTEPWAFSNNAAGSFGPPGWSDVRFTLQGDVTQQIRLNH